MIQNKIPSREIWIDLAKFISIFLVVLFHTNPHLDGYLFDFLQLLRMPAFFLIAGLLFDIEKWNSFTDFFIHRFKRLIVPYFWFTLIFYVLWLLVGRSMVGEEELTIGLFVPIKEFLLGKPRVVLGPYWFITCLFTMQILFYVLKKYVQSNGIIILLSISIYLGSIYFDIQDLPWCIDKAFLFLPFYAYANILKSRQENILFKKKTYAILLTIVTTILVIINNQYVNSPYLHHLLYVMAGFCIMPVYIVICKYLASILNSSTMSNMITYVGNNNIITLALQNYIIGFFKILGVWIFATNLLTSDYYIMNIVVAFVTIILSMGIAFLINKYASFIIGKRSKG